MIVDAFLILSQKMKVVHEINQQKLLTAVDGEVRTFYEIEVSSVQRMAAVALGIVYQLFIVELRCTYAKRIVAVQGSDIEMVVLQECLNQRFIIRGEVAKSSYLGAIIHPHGKFLKDLFSHKLLQMAIYGF